MTGRVIQGFFVGGARSSSLQRLARGTIACAAPAMDRSRSNSAGPLSAMPLPLSRYARPPDAAQRIAAPSRRPPDFARTVAQRFGGDASFAIDPVRLGLVRGGGTPLPEVLLAKMEAAFGTDFSAVRVHIGAQASRIGALAFTTGSDLYFAPGQYQPDSFKGQQLIGHELAHVVQQREGRVRAVGNGVSVVQDRALEAEADRMGARAANHEMPRKPSSNMKNIAQRQIPGPSRKGFGAPHVPAIQRALAVAPAPAPRPQHRISKATTPWIYWFTFEAIDRGAPTTLTYVANKNSTIYVRAPNQQIMHTNTLSPAVLADSVVATIRDVAREKVFSLGTNLKGASSSLGVPLSRDEYPYASTLECGTDAFWSYVPVSEQNTQGGQLAALYNRLNDRDEFDVVLTN